MIKVLYYVVAGGQKSFAHVQKVYWEVEKVPPGKKNALARACLVITPLYTHTVGFGVLGRYLARWDIVLLTPRIS